MQFTQNPTETWQLIHDDPFEKTVSDEDIEGVVAAFAARSTTPYTEVLRRLVGIEDKSEADAELFFRRVMAHRRELAHVLGRSVHVRVAALDVLTNPSPRERSEPGMASANRHPIVVTPSFLERAFEEASADALTGLPQRATFMNVLRHELLQRKRRSACVAFVDLDGFKRVNDAYGHAAGDDVLRKLVESARGSLRTGDVLARIGGDEFAVLILDATPAEAEAAIRRLRERFESLTASVGTSFSAGIAVAGAGETAERVLMRADQAMFRQKRSRAAALSG
jgi:diguanylate cyclase (GGDEF)-like protein